MIVLMLIEVKDESTAQDERRLRQRLHDDVRGCIEYACTYTLERLDVAGVDGVSEQSILDEVLPCPLGYRRRPGVEGGCGDPSCVRCYEPMP